jgi:hypothetical protein
MAIQQPRLPCHVVEWYRPEVTRRQLDDTMVNLDACVAAMRGEGTEIELLMTLALPAEEVVFAVFAARSTQTVHEACRRAGVPAERHTDLVDARIAG